jgi:glycosyltransferase involved in cell wall biosynthesis
MKTKSKSVSIVIPAYNEEEGIGAVLEQIPKAELNALGYEVEVIVVNNNCTDRTEEIARAHGATVVFESNPGYGNAYKAGFSNATGDIIATGDADSTYPMDAIPALLKIVEDGNIEFLNTNRLATLRSESMTAWHVFGNWVLTTISKILYWGIPFSDSQSGMWIFKRSVWEKLDVQSGGMPFSQELKVEAYWKGFKCAEANIEYRPRLGEVKLRGIHDAWLNLTELFYKRLKIRTKKILAGTDLTRVLIVSHYYPPHLGGIEIVAKNQAELLSKNGHRVTVVTSKVSSDEQGFVSDNLQVIRVRAWNITERFGSPFPIFSPRLLPVLLRQIRSADIVHIHDAFYMGSFFAAVFARFYGKPIVLTQHVAIVNHPSKFIMSIQKLVYTTTGALIFRMSSRIITLNDRVEQFLIDRNVNRSKLLALSNGVDLTMFHPVSPAEKRALRKKFNLSLEKKIILFVGRFVPKKGFDKVLAAQSNDYQIVFVGGEAPQKNTENVVFLGKFTQDIVAQVYQAADMFVLPSEGEGFPLSIQEAMATGLPIIMSHDEGYRRYNLDTNFIHFIENPTELNVRDAIETIINNDSHLHQMASYSKRYAESYFGWPKIMTGLVHIYDGLRA